MGKAAWSLLVQLVRLVVVWTAMFSHDSLTGFHEPLLPPYRCCVVWKMSSAITAIVGSVRPACNSELGSTPAVSCRCCAGIPSHIRHTSIRWGIRLFLISVHNHILILYVAGPNLGINATERSACAWIRWWLGWWSVIWIPHTWGPSPGHHWGGSSWWWCRQKKSS